MKRNLKSKRDDKITIEQAKGILPAWLSFMESVSKAKLSGHPVIKEFTSTWEKHFVPILDSAFYQDLK
ncbi:MAG: hypothetical protein M0R32_05745 [Candidatus Cloacimonetes bacterium]|jgi:hypothetical protein|nr:hypothetical protein [Candidatus Cloacimonadota bacterium]